MRIAGTEYDARYRALQIFISGCSWPHCNGCHNSELWDFNIGIDYTSFAIDRDMLGLIDHIWVMGGEPLDQDVYQLQSFLFSLSWLYGKPVWLWTRYYKVNINKLPFAYIKIGQYEADLPSHTVSIGGLDIKLASNNQEIMTRAQYYASKYYTSDGYRYCSESSCCNDDSQDF